MGDFRLNDSLVANLSVWASDAKPTAREVEALAREVQESRTEIKCLRAEIERLRAAGDALHAWITINATSTQQEHRDYDQVLDAWEEARRG